MPSTSHGDASYTYMEMPSMGRGRHFFQRRKASASGITYELEIINYELEIGMGAGVQLK